MHVNAVFDFLVRVSENAQVLQLGIHLRVPRLNVVTMEMYCNLKEFLDLLGVRSYCSRIR
jgi:hypothetical protein